jgi:hypothetical protein
MIKARTEVSVGSVEGRMPLYFYFYFLPNHIYSLKYIYSYPFTAFSARRIIEGSGERRYFKNRS